MRVFFDASSFAKRFIEEPGSDEVDQVCRETSVLGLSVLCLPEIVSVLNRRVREKKITRQSYFKIKYRLAEDIQEAELIHLLPSVIEQSVVLLESNTLGVMDALHIACALEWQAKLFVSSDKNQVKAAKQGGLRTRYIGTT